MKVDLTWLIAILLLTRGRHHAAGRAGVRIDRLHHRIDLSGAALDAQLIRRSRAAEALATSELVDPASAIVLARAASNSRNADPADPLERSVVESEMSRDLREVFADAAVDRRAAGHPEGRGAVRRPCRVLHAGGPVTPVPQRRRPVRATAASGQAGAALPAGRQRPVPETFEMDDLTPPAFEAFADRLSARPAPWSAMTDPW